jgi:hypothetical protein
MSSTRCSTACVMRPDSSARATQRRRRLEPISAAESELQVGRLPSIRKADTVPAGGASARFRVRFNELAFASHVGHAAPNDRDVARTARRRVERRRTNTPSSSVATPDARRDQPGELLKELPPRPGCPLADGLRVRRDRTTGELVRSLVATGGAQPECRRLRPKQ